MTLNLEGELRANATLEDVEAAVRRLDGESRTMLVIEVASGQRLTIGGGPDMFVVEAAQDDEHRWAVINPDGDEQSANLVVGGQLVDYPGKLRVGLASTLDAARTFAVGNGLALIDSHGRLRHDPWHMPPNTTMQPSNGAHRFCYQRKVNARAARG